jgi:hypothetical protein
LTYRFKRSTDNENISKQVRWMILFSKFLLRQHFLSFAF